MDYKKTDIFDIDTFGDKILFTSNNITFFGHSQ